MNSVNGQITKHIAWIDYAKGLGMIAIILNHIGGPVVFGQFTYPFELPIFFVVAGLTFRRNESFMSFIEKKIYRLLLPIFVFGGINAILSKIFINIDFWDRILGVIFQIPGQGDDMWFLGCLFVMEGILYFIIGHNDTALGSGTIILLMFCCGLFLLQLNVVIPWHVVNVLLLMPFVLVGYYIRKFICLIDECTTKTVAIVTGIFLVIYCIVVCYSCNYPIDIHLQDYGNLVLFYISALLGVASVLGISILIGRGNLGMVKNSLAFIGLNSLVYYAFQSKTITFLKYMLRFISNPFNEFVTTIFICCISCAILVIPSRLINRYCPFLVGK